LARLSTGESAQVYGIILVMYFVIAFVVTRIMRLLERRAKASVGQAPQASGWFSRKLPASPGVPQPSATGGGA
ncbi:MAG: ectoine/hydroxyectoine ABC transporter permease subunit EhuC, partial [Streptomyces sp.]|nr:ectoine/hydroxyectoine ABC transporter permease subunit EhuC [Streptomyces sp.]